MHAPCPLTLDVYLLGCGGTLIYSFSRVRVIVPGLWACVTLWRTQTVSSNPHKRTLHAFSRVVDARADVDLYPCELGQQRMNTPLTLLHPPPLSSLACARLMCSLTGCVPAGLWRYTHMFPLSRVRLIAPCY